MNQKLSYTIFLSLILILVLPVSLAAENTRTVERNGVKVFVTKISDSIKGFKAFQVMAENTSDGPRSLNMKIYLNDKYSKEPAGYRGKCTVFYSLKKGTTKNETKQCKETSKSNSWSLRIIKVYKFLMK